MLRTAKEILEMSAAWIGMQGVESSNLEGVDYDPDTLTLRVMFKGGSTYEYADVPIEEYEGLMAAESKGSYFYANIRRGGYEYTKIK